MTKHTKAINVKLTASQHAVLIAISKKSGKNISTLFRDNLLFLAHLYKI